MAAMRLICLFREIAWTQGRPQGAMPLVDASIAPQFRAWLGFQRHRTLGATLLAWFCGGLIERHRAHGALLRR